MRQARGDRASYRILSTIRPIVEASHASPSANGKASPAMPKPSHRPKSWQEIAYSWTKACFGAEFGGKRAGHVQSGESCSGAGTYMYKDSHAPLPEVRLSSEAEVPQMKSFLGKTPEVAVNLVEIRGLPYRMVTCNGREWILTSEIESPIAKNTGKAF